MPNAPTPTHAEADAPPASHRPFVVIATHNERANIGPLLQQLFAHQQPAVCVVLVDDASPDGTVAEARRQAAESDATERLTVIERPGKLGYGSAMAQGIARAREMGATAIVTMDADFSHDPAAVPALILRLDDPADCVVGSRYIGGIRVLNWPVFRLLLSVFANFYAGLILNLRVTDATSGFRAYRSEVFERVDLGAIRARGYAFLVEGMYRLRCAGFTVAEEPIVFSERREGQSKMSKWIILEAAFRPWWLLLLRLLRRF